QKNCAGKVLPISALVKKWKNQHNRLRSISHSEGFQKNFMLTSSSPYFLSILRIVAALLFFEHGSQKLFGFPPGQPYTGFPNFSLLGIAGMLEVAGGALLLV